MKRIYTQTLILSVLPLVLALVALLAYNRSLVADMREPMSQQLVEANRQAQYSLQQQALQISQTAKLLARSREIAAAMAERNTDVLYSWGSRIVASGFVDEVFFVSEDGRV